MGCAVRTARPRARRAPSANGLPSGMAYGRPSVPGCAGSMRRMLPSRSVGFWPVAAGIAAARRRRPCPSRGSRRDRSASPPPLWFGAKSGTTSSVRRRRRSARSPSTRVLVEVLVVVGVGVGDVEQSAVGREREAEQSLLACGVTSSRDVEHRFAQSSVKVVSPSRSDAQDAPPCSVDVQARVAGRESRSPSGSVDRRDGVSCSVQRGERRARRRHCDGGIGALTGAVAPRSPSDGRRGRSVDDEDHDDAAQPRRHAQRGHGCRSGLRSSRSPG